LHQVAALDGIEPAWLAQAVLARRLDERMRAADDEPAADGGDGADAVDGGA